MNLLFKIFVLSVLAGFTGYFECKWDATEYEKSNVGQFKHAIKELPKLALTGSEEILDIGSGDGKVSAFIAQRYVPNGYVDGLDKDNSMVNFARFHIGASVSNISFINEDILNFNTEKKYDIVFSSWTLHWLKKDEYIFALKKVASFLKPQGKALLCHIVEYDPIDKWILNTIKQPEWNSLIYSKKLTQPSLEVVLEAIRKSGLSIENIEVKKNGEWVSLEIFKQNLLSMPLFDFVPEQERRVFVDEVVKGYISDNPLNKHNEVYCWLPVTVLLLKKL